MPRVYYSTVIDAPVDAVWELTRDFNGLPKWHPGIVDSELEQGTGVGCVRHFTLKGGAKMREKLLALSDADRTVAYSILETGMKLKNYVAVLHVAPVVATNQTFAEWSAVFDVTDSSVEEETAATVYGVFSSGLESLKSMVCDRREYTYSGIGNY